MNATSERCNTCLYGTHELEPRPGSSWMVECSYCRMIREKRAYKDEQPDRIEAKLDELLERYKRNE